MCSLAGCGGGSKATPEQTLQAALHLQQQGKSTQAAQLLAQVIKAQPGNYIALYNLGLIDQLQGDDVGALTQYGKALTADPKYLPALFNEGIIYKTSDPANAIGVFHYIIKIHPKAPTAYLNLGLLEIAQSQPRQGVADLAVAYQQEPSLLSQMPAKLRHGVVAVAGGHSGSKGTSTGHAKAATSPTTSATP